jgi:hypothetical protein
MANIGQNLVYTGADAKVIIALPNGVTYPFITASKFDFNDTVALETIYALGQKQGIAVMSNETKFSGSFSLQSGEWAAFLALAGITSGVFIQNASLAFTTLTGIGPQLVYGNVYISDQKTNVAAKSHETLVDLTWMALTQSGIAVS